VNFGDKYFKILDITNNYRTNEKEIIQMVEDRVEEEIIKFWKGLIKYNVQIITHAHIVYKEGVPPTFVGPIDFKIPEKYSYREFHAFSMNISRIMHLYQELFREPLINFNLHINASSPYKNALIKLKDCVFAESIIILLISTIEVFLEDTFRKIARILEINTLDLRLIKKFLKLFNIDIKLKRRKKKLLASNLSSILPNRMDFQRSENCKIAYKLVGIDIPALNNSLWEHIFASKNSNSILSRRNSIIHALTRTLQRLDITKEDVRNDIEKTCEFIFNIEVKMIELFSDKIRPDFFYFS